METYGLPGPRVAILLCTFNGQDYLKAQLDSIEAQDFENWRIWASDDGSSDDTLKILNEYGSKWGGDRLTVVRGPGKGFVANFLSLLSRSEIKADYFSFSDQDDVWGGGKISRAVKWASSQQVAIPALYCSRTRLIDVDGDLLGFSPLFSASPGFRNALVQSIAGGNTMLFNEAARALIVRASGPEVVVHDWLAYLVVSGCGGCVYFDPYPSMGYRQHGANQIGSQMGWRQRIARLAAAWQGRFAGWSDRNIVSLSRVKDVLTEENKTVLALFVLARRRSILFRIPIFLRIGLYRQTMAGNVSLWAAALIGKL